MEVLLARRLGDPTLNIHPVSLACCLSMLVASAGWSQDKATARARPYFDARRQRTEYVGPAGQKLAPEQVTEVRIGYFGPSDPDDPVFGHMWRAAQAALDDANREGGFQGMPFRLVPAWSKDPWGTGVKRLTQLVYEQHVWAIVGGVDGPATHLAEQVVAKARLALVSPVSTDKTVNLANVPWMFSVAPGDHLVARSMAPGIAKAVGRKPFVFISAIDHDSFLLTRELRKSLDQLRVVPAYQFEFRPKANQLERIVHESLAAKPVAVVVIANLDDSIQLVRSLRHAGFEGRIFGGPSFGRHGFLNQMGAAVGDVRFPLLAESRRQPYTKSATNSLPADADFTALQTYDAVRLIIAAIRRAGLNRAEIGRELRQLAPWQGVSGLVHWDGLGSNMRKVTLGTIQDGRAVALRDSGDQ